MMVVMQMMRMANGQRFEESANARQHMVIGCREINRKRLHSQAAKALLIDLATVTDRRYKERLFLSALFLARILAFREHPNNQSRSETNQRANRHRANTEKLIHNFRVVFSVTEPNA